MKSQTSIIATQCRLQQWAQQIRDCQNRPADMQVGDWCEMNGITKANYYYRLRRVREACIAELETTAPTFVELPIAESPKAMAEQVNEQACAILKCKNGMSLEILPNTPTDFLKVLFGVMRDVE
ncbi:hypothetical protein SAMN02910358_01358 [Lachnospiraceae bacterium XBB1006]|nr:hypothetical protein SAMN02910358_01358 [Lachnospiraceae bacterium XBB1006]